MGLELSFLLFLPEFEELALKEPCLALECAMLGDARLPSDEEWLYLKWSLRLWLHLKLSPISSEILRLVVDFEIHR